MLSSLPPVVIARCLRGDPSLPAGATSLVAVCANRTASLLSVLPSWLAVRGVHEILILEWGPADEALSARLPRGYARVRLVRAPAEREWKLARLGRARSPQTPRAASRQLADSSAALLSPSTRLPLL